ADPSRGDAHPDHDDDHGDRDLEPAGERLPHDRVTARHPVPNALQLSPQFIDARVGLVLVPISLHVFTPLGFVTRRLERPLRPWGKPIRPGSPPGGLLSEVPLAADVGNKRYVYI